VPGQFTGLVIQAEQSRQRDADVNGWAHPVFAGQLTGRVAGEGVDRELDRGIGAALISGTRIVTVHAAG